MSAGQAVGRKSLAAYQRRVMDYVKPVPLGMQRRDCARCGQVFTPQRSTQRFCSVACVHAANSEYMRAHNRQLAIERERRRAVIRKQAKREGRSYRDALEIQMEKYWRSVAIPDYYSGVRYSPHSSLMGREFSTGNRVDHRDEQGFYGGKRGRGGPRG